MIQHKETLVLIHGWGFGSAIWHPLLPYLSEYYSIILVDLPGYADNSLPASWELDVLTHELAALVDKPAIWCGWSMGGLLAVEVAARFPEKVHSIVTLGTNPVFVQQQDWPHGVTVEMFTHFREELNLNADQLMRRFIAIVVQGSLKPKEHFRSLCSLMSKANNISNEVLSSGLLLLEKMDVRQHLCTLNIPNRHLLGVSDALVPVAVATDISNLNHKTQVEIIKAPHWLWADAPELLAKAIMDK